MKVGTMCLGIAGTLLLFACGVRVGGGPVAAGGQGHMHSALQSLEAAKTELSAAEANKGGHRERAMDLVDQAIVQVREGINYARR